MRLGLSSYTYTWSVGVPGHSPACPLTAWQLLDRAAALGVPVVQIADNLPLHLMSARDRQGLADRAAELAIHVEVGTRGIAAGHLREYLSLARQFGSPILRVVIGEGKSGPAGWTGPDAAESVTEALLAHRPAFEDAGVVLAIENHDLIPVATLAHMIQDLGPHWAGVCLDTANSLGALEGTATVLDTLLPWTVNVHVKDVEVSRVPHMMGFMVEGRPAGQGQLGVAALLQRLAAARREVPGGHELSAILELWTPPEPTLELTIEKEQCWAQESIQFLASAVTLELSPAASRRDGETV
jgi:sugar phosphate isomerase/epimerase